MPDPDDGERMRLVSGLLESERAHHALLDVIGGKLGFGASGAALPATPEVALDTDRGAGIRQIERTRLEPPARQIEASLAAECTARER